MTLIKPFFIATFLLSFGYGEGLQAAPASCPTAVEVNAALGKWAGNGPLKVGEWSGYVLGSKGIKVLNAPSGKSFLYGRKQHPACNFKLNNNKTLILCNPGLCPKNPLS